MFRLSLANATGPLLTLHCRIVPLLLVQQALRARMRRIRTAASEVRGHTSEARRPREAFEIWIQSGARNRAMSASWQSLVASSTIRSRTLNHRMKRPPLRRHHVASSLGTERLAALGLAPFCQLRAIRLVCLPEATRLFPPRKRPFGYDCQLGSSQYRTRTGWSGGSRCHPRAWSW